MWKEDFDSFDKKYYKELNSGMPAEWVMYQTPTDSPFLRDKANKEYVSTKDGIKEVNPRTDRKLTIEEANELEKQTPSDPRRNH